LSVPLGYVLSLIGGFAVVLGGLWFGVVVKVFVDMEGRLVVAETYMDPRNELLRNDALMLRIKVMLAETELRLKDNLESKRASIESTITRQVGEVVETLKANGGGGR